MTPFFDNGVTAIFQGDAREVLAQMEANSVDCVVTSLSQHRLMYPGVIQGFYSEIYLFAGDNLLLAPNVLPELLCLTPAILLLDRFHACPGLLADSAEFQQYLRLLYFYFQIRQKGMNCRNGLSICGLPQPQHLPMFGGGFFLRQIAAEGFFQKMRYDRRDLLQSDTLMEGRTIYILSDTNAVCRAPNCEIPIGVQGSC